MKKLITVLLIILCFSFIFCSTSFAVGAKYTATNSFFTEFDPNSTSYVYDEDNGTDATDGQYYVRNYAEKTIQVRIPTLGSTSIDFRIEGRVQGSSNWAEVYYKNFSSATTVDELIMVTEHLDYLRVGLKVNTDGTDSVSVIGNFATTGNLR